MSFQNILKDLTAYNTNLVAVSKTKPQSAILELYEEGQRVFGENRVQELVDKQDALPKDIQWHMIGHLQTNKVKYIAPFVHLIHSVDSPKILKEINKQAVKNDRTIDCLIQFHIAEEDSKYGFGLDEAMTFLKSPEFQGLQNVRIVGVMGMATFTEDENQVRNEFRSLKEIFDLIKKAFFEEVDSFKEISMGMSGDYKIAMEEGSTMVRIGSLLFGARR